MKHSSQSLKPTQVLPTAKRQRNKLRQRKGKQSLWNTDSQHKRNMCGELKPLTVNAIHTHTYKQMRAEVNFQRVRAHNKARSSYLVSGTVVAIVNG